MDLTAISVFPNAEPTPRRGAIRKWTGHELNLFALGHLKEIQDFGAKFN